MVFAEQHNSLQKAYLEYLSQEIGFSSDIQNCCFKLRFNPKNHGKEHGAIADQMYNAGQIIAPKSISPIVSKVVRKVKDVFGTEMKDDGVPVELIGNGGKGSPKPEESPYEITYQWLWEKKFPRVAWELAKKIGTYADERLKMNEIQNGLSRKPDLKGIPADDNSIKKDQHYRLQVTLEEKGNLLLIEEDGDGWKGLIYPSRAYASEPYVELKPNQSLDLPPGDFDWSLTYSETGTEYFMAIVTEKPVEISWVTPDCDRTDIDLSGDRLTELFTLVGKQTNSWVFYKKFKVHDE